MGSMRNDGETGAFQRACRDLETLENEMATALDAWELERGEPLPPRIRRFRDDLRDGVEAVKEGFDAAMKACLGPPLSDDDACTYCRGQGAVVSRDESHYTCPQCRGSGEIKGVYRRVQELEEEIEAVTTLLDLYRLKCSPVYRTHLGEPIDKAIKHLDAISRTYMSSQTPVKPGEAREYLDGVWALYFDTPLGERAFLD